MICFMDRSFCASVGCKNDCGRKMSDELREKARLSGLPVSWGYFCEDKQMEKNDE